MLQSQRFYAPVAAAQQFERTCINEQSHGARIPAGSPPNCSVRNRPPDPDRDASGEPRTALAQRSDSFASGRLSFFSLGLFFVSMIELPTLRSGSSAAMPRWQSYTDDTENT